MYPRCRCSSFQLERRGQETLSTDCLISRSPRCLSSQLSLQANNIAWPPTSRWEYPTALHADIVQDPSKNKLVGGIPKKNISQGAQNGRRPRHIFSRPRFGDDAPHFAHLFPPVSTLFAQSGQIMHLGSVGCVARQQHELVPKIAARWTHSPPPNRTLAENVGKIFISSRFWTRRRNRLL